MNSIFIAVGELAADAALLPHTGRRRRRQRCYAFYNKWWSRDITRESIYWLVHAHLKYFLCARAAFARGLRKAKSTKKLALLFIDLFNRFNLYWIGIRMSDGRAIREITVLRCSDKSKIHSIRHKSDVHKSDDTRAQKRWHTCTKAMTHVYCLFNKDWIY